MSEFRAFSEITRLSSQVTITEKIHGTNAQVMIEEVTVNSPVELPAVGIFVDVEGGKQYAVYAGSRTRWLTPDDDNYGFARWVHENASELLSKLGVGRHFGEWFGSGINSGYGMTKGEKKLALFDQRFAGKDLPAGVTVVPVLYQGPWTSTCVDEAMGKLKESSVIAPGFTKPEGVVIRFERNGATFKQVFEAEETGWKNMRKDRPAPAPVDEEKVSALLQPIRFEKLLSRDERYVREYPKSLPDIAKDYVADLEKESQFDGVEDDVAKSAKKRVFPWVKQMMLERGYST